MWRRAIVAKYTGCGNQPNGTSNCCLARSAACDWPGPPTIDERWVAHATAKELSTTLASPAAIAFAAV
jgi:hypothetical protein